MEKQFKEAIDWLNNNYFNGYPHFTILFVNNIFKIAEWNNKSISSSITDHKNHSEYKLIEIIKKYSQNKIKLVQMHPPCNYCLDELAKLNIDLEILFLFDHHNKFRRKKYLLKYNHIKIKYINKQNTANYEIINYAWNKFIKRINSYCHKRSLNRIQNEWKDIEKIKYFMQDSVMANTINNK